MESIPSDEDKEPVLELDTTEYKPLCIHVQLATADGVAQTPPADDRAYFPAAQFVGPDSVTQCDVPGSDSENERYQRVTGKGKTKTLPKSDAGFGHQKAMPRKTLRRIKRHLEPLNAEDGQFYDRN